MRHIGGGAVLLALLACSDPTGPGIEGAWGGPDASLTLTRAGGTVQYQCGAGTIDPTWAVSADGTFAGTGRHEFGGGPAPVGGRPTHPATYAGRLAAGRFTLTVRVTDLDVTLGPFALVRGGPTVTEICF